MRIPVPIPYTLKLEDFPLEKQAKEPMPTDQRIDLSDLPRYRIFPGPPKSLSKLR